MSLLLNEDFSTYLLRQSYLSHTHDGVGERLITLNTSVLNNPAFRAAGWLPDTASMRRCYSPPIPTTGVGAEYFQAPRKTRGASLEDETEGDGGGMVTGHHGSEDTIGAGGLGVNEKKRRRRKEQLEEDDSSDLSDDSDEEEKTAAQGIKFNKMPVRGRSKSDLSLEYSMLKADVEKDGPALMITSPSRPPEAVGQGLRIGSLGQVEAVKQRARRDTTTSSDMSSENELDPNAFARKLPGKPAGKKAVLLAERIQEEEQRDLDAGGETADSDLEDEDVGEASDLSDEFEVDDDGAMGSHSPQLLGMGVGGASDDTSPIRPPPNVPPAITPHDSSPKKAAIKDDLPRLPKLPPGGRMVSLAQPSSLLTQALKGEDGGEAGEKAFQRFAHLSGKGEASPLWIKIYAPFSEMSGEPIEVPLRRSRDGSPVTVAELIGLALWRYNEEGYQPVVEGDEGNINRWTLRIVEDDEVDFDFPALGRTRPVTDFTSNNNRPPQRRARDKPWDEFGLVKATDEQCKESEDLTPQLGLGGGLDAKFITAPTTPAAHSALPTPKLEPQRPEAASRMASEATMQTTRSATPGFQPPHNPITGPSFAPSALRKDTGTLLDQPQRDNPQSTPRTGAPKTVTVHFTDPNSFSTSKLAIPTTSDTYIAELFNHSCKKLGLDKAEHVLKVQGTQTVAPSDRTVEALGDRVHLDLVRRRFVGAGAAGDGIFGLGLSGSPGSSSPNAPLELPGIGTPPTHAKKGRKAFGIHAAQSKTTDLGLAAQPSMLNLVNTAGVSFAHPSDLTLGGKKYNVLRKQPLSFAPSHPRTLIILPDYLQILPAAPDSLAAPTGKVTDVPMSSIIGVKVSRKHLKMVRVLVYREKETKRYDFECGSGAEAADVVADVRRGIALVRDGDA